MKKIILGHAVIETLGGLLLIFNPAILMIEPLSTPLVSVIKLFGVLVFAFGLGSILIYRTFEYSKWYKMWVLLFMGYHFIQALQCYGFYNIKVLSNMGAFVLHLVLAGLFMVTFMRERELYPE